ncbi:MAG: electron transfer flavoprotein subunit beta/FixA family protein [Mogibacterium sp.]|nr:electron transfer flavoprotein subunit beta/FixA family protein [Mogibacterium sp.]
MKIAVCIKSVPDPDCYDKITLDPVNKTLNRAGIPAVINVADKHAIEAALQLKEEYGGSITVVSMGPPPVEQQLREALAMGADDAYLLSDRKVGGADTLATSYAVSKLIEQTGPYDIILAGNESADGATSHVPAQIAEWMGLGCICSALSIRVEDGKAIVTKKFENGTGTFRLGLPCVIAVNQRINKVRLTNMMAVLKAKKKPLTVFSAADITGLDESRVGLAGSPTQNGELHMAESTKVCTMLEGTEEEAAAMILEKIKPLLKA